MTRSLKLTKRVAIGALLALAVATQATAQEQLTCPGLSSHG